MKREFLTPESIARAAELHRKLAKLYDELSDVFDVPEAPPPPGPPSELDRARVKRTLARRGYKVVR